MGDVSEIQEAKNFITDKLSGKVEIAALVSTRIYADFYAGVRVWPYIIINLMAASDTDGLGTNRIQTSALFQVRAVCKGAPDSDTKKLGKLIDDVLQFQVVQSSGDFLFSSRREGEIDRPEFDQANTRYHNVGGLYRLYIWRAA